MLVFTRARIAVIAALACPLLSSEGLRAQPEDVDEGAESAPEDGEPQPDRSDAEELARVRAEYQAGRYNKCARMLATLLDLDGPRPLEDPEVIRDARIYRASCLMGAGKNTEADEELKRAVLDNPTYEFPDRRIFPPEVVDRWISIRLRHQEEIKRELEEEARRRREAQQRAEAERQKEAARVRGLEALAQRETVTTRNSRWIAAVPFGVGQFQNRSPVLGWIFLTSETLLLATTITFATLELSLYRDAARNEAAGKTNDTQRLNADLDLVSSVWTVSGWSLLAVAGIGVLEAQLSYVPQFAEVKHRPLPESLRPTPGTRPTRPRQGSFVPWLAPQQGGAALGVAGSF